jgi:cyclase|tara:strand:+ start:2573 stop:3334 length:762 start_codon:yes stop_codon:yes gene_type:complete
VTRVRIIPRLDIKGPNLIKGIHLEGLRVIGDPQVFSSRYYEGGADELLYVDVVASLYGRNSLHETIRQVADNVFVPMTVAGGIRSVDDVRQILRSGADKVAVNTAAVQRPELLREIAETFGSQCMVLSVEAKQVASGRWEAYTDNGRERSGREVVEWVKQATSLGIGEVLLTSVDREGTRKGFDIELVQAVETATNVPVIASGGMGTIEHLEEVVRVGKADAIAMADILHYDRMSLPDVRLAATAAGMDIRRA